MVLPWAVPTLANIFLYHYEDIWLYDCELQCKPSYYKPYVNNIFVLFESETQVKSFKNFMGTFYLNEIYIRKKAEQVFQF